MSGSSGFLEVYIPVIKVESIQSKGNSSLTRGLS